MKLRTLSFLFLILFLIIAPLAASGQEASIKWSSLLRQADKLHHQGQFAPAVDAAKRALNAAKSTARPDLNTATSHFLLGTIYRDWGHCAEARTNFSRAITIFEKQPDGHHQHIFDSIVSLINTSSECEEFDIAEKLYRIHRAALDRYTSGPLDDAKVLGILGGIARGRKHYAEAEDHFRRSIQILEQTPGNRRVTIAEIRSSMSLMMVHQGHTREALGEAEQAASVLENASPRPPTLPAALNNVACILLELGRTEDAERMYQRALQMARELFGEDNRNTATIMMNYAVLLQRDKQPAAADDLKKKGAEAYRRSLLRDGQTVDIKELDRSK